MSLDLSAVGFTTPTFKFDYDWKTLATYALGIGAKKDELHVLYEGTEGGICAIPTFAVVPAFDPVFETLKKTGGNLETIVHGGQIVRAHASIPPKGTLSTTATLTAIYDLKRFGQVYVETRTEIDGALAYETVWSIIFRSDGNFGGPRPAKESPFDVAPSIPKETAPTWSRSERTSPEQALLYRLSGDINPLHADPAFAAKVGFSEGPILHGLATFGFLGRAVIANACGGDPRRLRTLGAQFRKPVWPGDTLAISGYAISGSTHALSTEVAERNEAVLGNAFAEVSET